MAGCGDSRRRAARVTQLLPIAQGGLARPDLDVVAGDPTRQSASGHNIYVFPLMDFASGVLALLGESGRRDLLEEVGRVLDTYSPPLADRRAWAALLQDL